jgi:hypothetical protein
MRCDLIRFDPGLNIGGLYADARAESGRPQLPTFDGAVYGPTRKTTCGCNVLRR